MSPGLMDLIATPSEPSEVHAEYAQTMADLERLWQEVGAPSDTSEAMFLVCGRLLSPRHPGHTSDDGGKSWRELTKAEAEKIAAWREAVGWPVERAPHG